jgi:hypothetical protein
MSSKQQLLDLLWGGTILSIDWQVCHHSIRLRVHIIEGEVTRVFLLRIERIHHLVFHHDGTFDWNYAELTSIQSELHSNGLLEISIEL